jgi:hypothetical protein
VVPELPVFPADPGRGRVLSEIYQKKPTSTDIANAKSAYHFSSWGSQTDWSGDCVMYVGLAWWRAGQTIHGGKDAYSISQTYSLHTGTPPRGAAVFWGWPWTSPGHVAISLGNGLAVTTVGTDGDLIPTTQASITTVNSGKRYLGWTPNP